MEDRHTPPYRPLWVYHFFAFIDRLPIPGWLLCLLIVMVGVADHRVAWQQGSLPFGQINAYLSSVGLYIVLMPFVWAFLTQRAHHALSDFFQESSKSHAYVQTVISDFNSLPSWELILLLSIGLFSGFFAYYKVAIPLVPFSAQVLPFLSLLAWSINVGVIFPLIARAIRQIALIKRLYEELEVDIFNLRPVYVLSRYSSLISIILLTMMYGLQSIVLPSFLFTPLGIFFQFLVVTSALSLFFFPLADVNRIMHRAKERMLSELNEDLKDVQQRVHRSVASKGLAKISDLRTAVSALKEEIDIVQKIRTWPWQTETLRNLLTPLLIPIFVYLVQRVLGGVLGLQ